MLELLKSPRQFDATQPRHRKIAQNDIRHRRGPENALEGFLAIGDRLDLADPPAQGSGQEPPHDGLIVDDQHS